MKELKISELMDSYVDNEVCIEGETSVDNEELKGLVLKQAKTKRKMKPLFKGIIAAAAAVVLAGTATAATVATVAIKGGFTSTTGTNISYSTDENGDSYISISDSYKDFKVPIELTGDGRLIFVADGQNKDVTDIIDEKTPYIYAFTEADGSDSYMIVGGTPEDYGWVQLIYMDGIGWEANGGNATIRENWCTPLPDSDKYKAWYLAAAYDILGYMPSGGYDGKANSFE